MDACVGTPKSSPRVCMLLHLPARLRLLHVGARVDLFPAPTCAHEGAVSRYASAPFLAPAARAPSAPMRMHAGLAVVACHCDTWVPLQLVHHQIYFYNFYMKYLQHTSEKQLKH
jgi:hypothetical protein